MAAYYGLPEGFAPVQGDGSSRESGGQHPSGMIEWAEHVEVWQAYAKRYGNFQTAERIAERGGFGFAEAAKLLGRELQTWQPRHPSR